MTVKNIFSLLEKIAQEKGVSKEKVVEILKTSFEKAYLKENPDIVFEAVLDPEKETLKLFEKRIVVDKNENDIDDDKEIHINEAIKEKPSIKLGDEFIKEIDIRLFERRVAGHVSQVLNQNINEISSKKVYEEWKDKEGFIIKAEVEKTDERLTLVNLGDTKGVVLKADQIPNEELIAGQTYLFLIKKVEQQSSKGWQIILSRTDERLLKFILTNEVSEIKSGEIQIKKMVRMVGYKTKVALVSTVPGVDPISIVVGPRGERIKTISQQLNNEKIDVILYDENPKQFLVNACYPEKIIGLEISDDDENPESKIITIVADESSLSKLIGKGGINIKLLNKLTGWQIDIISKEIADEDDVKYENVSTLESSKVKQTRFTTSFKNSKNNRKNNKDFSFNSFDEDTTFDKEYEGIQGITDEDVEKLINFDSDNSSKKKRKNKEDDEEVVLVAGNYEEDSYLNDNDNNIIEESNDIEVKQQVEETKEEPTEKDEINSQIVQELEEPVKSKKSKSTKTSKSQKSSESKRSKKDNKKDKVSLDELLEEDVYYEEETNNVDDLDNLELDEE